MARPKTIIDWEVVDKYLQAQCDGVGIAGILGISPDTLYRACEEQHKQGFAFYSQQKRAEGKELLRGKMFNTAMNGSNTMQIWLSKQYLDMSDNPNNTSIDLEVIQTIKELLTTPV